MVERHPAQWVHPSWDVGLTCLPNSNVWITYLEGGSLTVVDPKVEHLAATYLDPPKLIARRI